MAGILRRAPLSVLFESLALLVIAGCQPAGGAPGSSATLARPPASESTQGPAAERLPASRAPGTRSQRPSRPASSPKPTSPLTLTSTCDVPQSLDFAIEGYGAATVGGWQTGHDVVCVTSLADDGPGSLREAARTGGVPRVIGFALDGDIALSAPIDLPSNISIDGRGHDVRVIGKGFYAHGVDNVILTHLGIEDVAPDSEDGIQIGFPDMTPSTRIVLDHLEFGQSGQGGNSAYVDEAVSVIYGAHDITIAWCHFQNWEKIMLFGNGDAPAELDSQITVTVHHNLFEETGRRHPQARYGQFDFYDNFLDDWHMFDHVGPPIWHESFGALCEDGCQLLYEQNIFERHWHKADLGAQANQASTCESGGAIHDRGGWVTPETTVNLRFDVHCPTGTLERPYPATIDPADEILRDRLLSETGNQLTSLD